MWNSYLMHYCHTIIRYDNDLYADKYCFLK